MPEVFGSLLRARDGQEPTGPRGRSLLTWILRLAREDSGQDLVEYALLTASVGLAGAAVFAVMGLVLNTAYTNWDSGTQNLWESTSRS